MNGKCYKVEIDAHDIKMQDDSDTIHFSIPITIF